MHVDIYQHHQVGLEVEPTGKAGEQLTTVNRGGDERGRLQLEAVNGETS